MVTGILADIIMTGRKVNNFITDATDNAPTNAKWTSTTEQEYTVPSGKRWYLLGGIVNADVNATCTVRIEDSSNNIIQQLHYESARTGICAYPQQYSSGYSQNAPFIMILDAGELVKIVMGAAQGAGAFASCVVIEVTL